MGHIQRKLELAKTTQLPWIQFTDPHGFEYVSQYVPETKDIRSNRPPFSEKYLLPVKPLGQKHVGRVFAFRTHVPPLKQYGMVLLHGLIRISQKLKENSLSKD